jgi:hypothetical protein
MEEFDRDLIVMPRGGGASSNHRRSLLTGSAPAFTGSSAFADDDKAGGRRDLQYSRRGNFWIEVIPIWIGLLDQSYLPGSIPFLQALLSPDRGFDIVVRFVIDKAMNGILFAETRELTRAMLVTSSNQIICHADIERSSYSACKDVDPVIAFGLIRYFGAYWSSACVYWIIRLRGR